MLVIAIHQTDRYGRKAGFARRKVDLRWNLNLIQNIWWNGRTTNCEYKLGIVDVFFRKNSLEYTHEETVRLIPRRTSTLIAYDDLYTDEEYYTFHKYMRPDRDLCLYMGNSIITGTLVPLCKYSYLFVLSQEGEKYIEFDIEIECSIESQEHS